MNSRSHLIVAGLVFTVVTVAAFALWYTSAGERFDRRVDELSDLAGVDGVQIDGDKISSLALDRKISRDELGAVLDLLDDIGSPTVSNGTRVDVGWITSDVFDLPVTWESMAAAGDLSRRGRPLQARAIGPDVWIETTLGTADQSGGLEPTPAEAARVLLPVLESLREHGVPDELELVVGSSENNAQDLVVVRREALVDVDATIGRIRDLAQADPETVITCDATECRTD
ncbi:hypothetical protein BH11ACT8_BH11ACT8_29510 [soil metagenome]